jgi:peptide deformylase
MYIPPEQSCFAVYKTWGPPAREKKPETPLLPLTPCPLASLFVLCRRMHILTLGDETLRMKAAAVGDIDGEMAALAQDMIEAMRGGHGIGLAGPQVGKLLRIFVTHIDRDQPRVFINPSIVMTSPELTGYEEGCLSIPGMYAEVVRPQTIQVQAWNERGRPFNLEADGLLARVILHEYDHLEGVLFIDRLSELKRERVLSQYEKKKRM